MHALKNEELLQRLANQLATFLRQLQIIPAEELAVKLPNFQGCEEWRDLYDRFRSKLFPCSVSYGEPFLERFSVMYPDMDTVLSRARFYAGSFALQEALYGIEDGDQESYERGIAKYR